MYEHLFSHVDIEPAHINLLRGSSSDINAECLEYEEKIKRVGGVDLFFGGIGPNGHIAFNEPGSSLSSRTRVKTLAHETLLANSRIFGGDVSSVPKLALTVGVQTVMEVRVLERSIHAMFLLGCLEIRSHILTKAPWASSTGSRSGRDCHRCQQGPCPSKVY